MVVCGEVSRSNDYSGANQKQKADSRSKHESGTDQKTQEPSRSGDGSGTVFHHRTAKSLTAPKNSANKFKKFETKHRIHKAFLPRQVPN